MSRRVVERVRWPGVAPLELWDALVSGDGAQALHLVPPPLLPEAIAAVVVALREGRATSATRGPIARADFAAVVVAGGGPVASVVAALAARGLPARAAREPLYFGAAPGLAILEGRRRGPCGVVVDVGQTSIKIARVGEPVAAPARVRVERPAALDADGVARLVESLGAPAVVLALPCEVEAADGGSGVVLGACTYWPEGTAWAGVDGVDVFVLNDAELAAAAVVLEGAPASGATLVLTVGFGVGAAVVS